MEEYKICTCCGQKKKLEDMKWRSRINNERSNLCKACDSAKKVKYQKKRKAEMEEIKITITKEQKEALKEKAKELNTTAGRYLKRLATEEQKQVVIYKEVENYSEVKTLLSQIGTELSKWGSNLNQLAKNSNIEVKGGFFNFGKKKDDNSEKINELAEVISDLKSKIYSMQEYLIK